MILKPIVKDTICQFTSPIMAGICISVGCIANLMSGCGVVGAVLFTFGLITVVHYKYSLYTGTAGFVGNRNDMVSLFAIILVGNIIGCGVSAICSSYAIDGLGERAYEIAISRTMVNPLQAFIRAIFCGFLMTTAVKFARKGKWLPLIFAVPVFILSGFYHSIADSFYIFCADTYKPVSLVKCHYGLIIIGNFIGCNIYRLAEKKTLK